MGVVPIVLRFRENILPLLKGRRVRLISPSMIVDLRILSQVIVECSFLIGGLVDQFKATSAVRDVRISATSIIRVVNGF